VERKLAIARELPRLRRFARALSRDPVAADDLVQDCVERALVRIDQLKRHDNPRPWLFAIMRNLYRDNLRATQRRPEPVNLHTLPGLQHAEPARQPGIVAANAVLNALATLPPERREALALVAVEGCSYREAAGILDIPVGTLMSRLGRGRAQLRATLDNPPERTSHLRSVKP